jgi:hypothetical protein
MKQEREAATAAVAKAGAKPAADAAKGDAAQSKVGSMAAKAAAKALNERECNEFDDAAGNICQALPGARSRTWCQGSPLRSSCHSRDC